MEDVLAKAWAQIKWEEDEANFVGKANIYGNKRNDRVDRRSNDRRLEPYWMNDRRNTQSRHEGSNDKNSYGCGNPKLNQPCVEAPEYNFSIEPVNLVAVMKEMGKTVKWP